MKLLLLFVSLAFASAAQTYNVCVQLIAAPAKQVCTTITASQQAALDQLRLTEGTTVNGVFTPKYTSTADIINTHIAGLLDSTLDRFPQGALATAVTAKATADAAVVTQKAAAIPKPAPVADPK